MQRGAPLLYTSKQHVDHSTRQMDRIQSKQPTVPGTFNCHFLIMASKKKHECF